MIKKPIDPAIKIIQDAANTHQRELQLALAHAKEDARAEKERAESAERQLQLLQQAAETKVPRPLQAPKLAKAAKHAIRVVIPDSHGNHIDDHAAAIFLKDLKWLAPQEIVMLGDHLDCGGTFSQWQRTYTNELTESYVEDLASANHFLDRIRQAAPNARIHYLEGNHEAHVERWASRQMHARADAELLVDVLGPEAQLKLKAREITYYRTKEFHMGLAIRGSIQLGKCFFTHGISHAKHAETQHLNRFSANVVFGHVHRVMSIGERTVSSSGFGAWCCGTLAKLQPLYKHTEPTSWQHGYGVQFFNESTGRFTHLNIPIFEDGSGLPEITGALQGRMK